MAYGSPVTPFAKILSRNDIIRKANGPKGREKDVAMFRDQPGSPIFPLRFKIGEPSCLATLKMT